MKKRSHRVKPPMSKEMLLPLAADVVRQKSLEHHLALVTLRSGNGNSATTGRLFHSIYLAYLVHEATVGRCNLDDFRAAEASLQSSAVRAKKDAVWQISEEGCAAIERVLATHDQQLANLPRHVIASAQEKMSRFLGTDELSPIARA